MYRKVIKDVKFLVLQKFAEIGLVFSFMYFGIFSIYGKMFLSYMLMRTLICLISAYSPCRLKNFRQTDRERERK
jgi:hypothetical protein